MNKKQDVEIRYFGYDYCNHHFINSQEMRDFLAEHDYLKIAVGTIDEETGEETLKPLTFPITGDDANSPIMILDTRLDREEMDIEEREANALFIHHEDDAYAFNPSPEFMEILKMMQADYAKREEELFDDVSTCDYEGERWNWEFDFTTGTYIKPTD